MRYGLRDGPREPSRVASSRCVVSAEADEHASGGERDEQHREEESAEAQERRWNIGVVRRDAEHRDKAERGRRQGDDADHRGQYPGAENQIGAENVKMPAVPAIAVCVSHSERCTARAGAT
jgi:hypothetical protein